MGHPPNEGHRLSGRLPTQFPGISPAPPIFPGLRGLRERGSGAFRDGLRAVCGRVTMMP